jgi:hypothetical protein
MDWRDDSVRLRCQEREQVVRSPVRPADLGMSGANAGPVPATPQDAGLFEYALPKPLR